MTLHEYLEIVNTFKIRIKHHLSKSIIKSTYLICYLNLNTCKKSASVLLVKKENHVLIYITYKYIPTNLLNSAISFSLDCKSFQYKMKLFMRFMYHSFICSSTVHSQLKNLKWHSK